MDYGIWKQRLKGCHYPNDSLGDIDENHDLRRDENWDFVWYPHKSIEPVVNIQSGRKEKGGTRMINDFFAFNINGINNILYLLQTNLSFIIILIGVIG